jgi:hypothetical protein
MKVIKVDARNTTQECSNCAKKRKMAKFDKFGGFFRYINCLFHEPSVNV